MFTTFVNWQIRGELQGLRFRLMDDQRPSARKVDATTISLHSIESGPDGEEMSLEALLPDEHALAGTEAAAADHLAAKASEALMDEYVRHLRSIGIAQLKRKAKSSRILTPSADKKSSLPKYVHSRAVGVDPEELDKLEERIARDRDIVARHLFANVLDPASLALDEENGLTKERIRQITRRAARVMSELASGNPRFSSIARDDSDLPDADAHRNIASADIYPAADLLHNRMVRVSAPDMIGDDMLTGAAHHVFHPPLRSRARH
jgi:RNA polymerase sigma-32 factor